jgi:hypothetical protein
MNTTASGEGEELWRSRPQKLRGPAPIKGSFERYYKKKYFSMNIFKKSLTKKFYWNKNYTKSSNMQGSSSSEWWGLLAFRRAVPCEVVGQSLVIYLSRIRVKRAMRI